MTDLPNLPSLEFARDEFRIALVKAGFIDDGEKLRGIITWKKSNETFKTLVDVKIDERFPFFPPKVSLADTSVVPTFHIERSGDFCLWDNANSYVNAPWTKTNVFLLRIADWLEKTSMEWPEDIDADLERYLGFDSNLIVFYDNLKTQKGFFTTSKPHNGIVHVLDKPRWKPKPTKKRKLRRKEKRLIWVANVGEITKPIKNWKDLTELIPQDVETLLKLIYVGSLEYIMVRYKRVSPKAPIACLVVKVLNKIGEDPSLTAVESADKSSETRVVRSGNFSPSLGVKKVLIVGCGAIGSHIADILFRSGLKNLTLVDHEKIRPGNLVRHLVSNEEIGINKAIAVKLRLASTGLDVEKIKLATSPIGNIQEAIDLVKENDLIIDATANGRATTLLGWVTGELNKKMLSVCLQRKGEVIRIDRYPLTSEEKHLSAIPRLQEDDPTLYENGCGSPVSRTPPLSVQMAATLSSEFALSVLRGDENLPPTKIQIIKEQPDEPYNKIGILVG